jgi:hypothetical protein
MPTFTMRLPDEDYEALQAMSLLTGRSMAELVRDAVSDSLTRFASSGELDQSFKEELRVRELALETLKQRLPDEQRDAAGDSQYTEVPTAGRASASTGKNGVPAAKRRKAIPASA